nr:ribonuclease H-like domain, reverse transcriptase, RNA-dependent DNA polymerase [Tanacetum cinerariifolium]
MQEYGDSDAQKDVDRTVEQWHTKNPNQPSITFLDMIDATLDATDINLMKNALINKFPNHQFILISGKLVSALPAIYTLFAISALPVVPSQHLTKLDDRSTKMVYLGNEQGSKAFHLFDPTTQRVCVSRDVKFKENETWDWKDYMSEHINDEPEWTDFKIENLEVTNEHPDQEIQPIKEDNESPNNNNDDYSSPTRDTPSHSQTHNTPSTSSSQVNSQFTPNISTQSYYQSDNYSIPITDSPSHFDHTSLRGFRTLNDLYENTKELLLAEDEPKNYKEASSDQK